MALDKLSGNSFATGAIANSLGYTPANKAGDTFTGALAVSNTLSTGNTTITGFANVSSTLNVVGHHTGTTGQFSSYLVTGSTVSADPGANYYSFTHRMGGSLAVANNIAIGANTATSTLTVTGNATFTGTTWTNASGGDVRILSNNSVGASVSLKPTNSGSYAAGWSLYAGAGSSNIGDGSFGFWNHTNSTAPFFVTKDGYVRTPNNVSFLAYHNGGDVNYGVGSILPYQNVRHNVGGGYNTSNGTFTAPVAGTYLFSASCNGNRSTSLSDVPRAYWRVNGSNIGNGIHFRGAEYEQWNGSSFANDTSLNQKSLTIILELAAGDYVNIYVGVNRFDLFGANHFCGYLIG